MRLPLLLALVSAFAACSSDPTDGNPPAPQDAQPTDIGQDATDVQRVDVGEDRPAPMDAGADAGFDVGFEAALQELPAPDAGDSGTARLGRKITAAIGSVRRASNNCTKGRAGRQARGAGWECSGGSRRFR